MQEIRLSKGLWLQRGDDGYWLRCHAKTGIQGSINIMATGAAKSAFFDWAVGVFEDEEVLSSKD